MCEEVLEKDLVGVARCVEYNRLKLNAKKTQLLLMGRKSRTQELESVRVMLNSEQLPISHVVKCLGVRIDGRLTWMKYIETVRKNCFCGLAKLRRLQDVLPPVTKRIL